MYARFENDQIVRYSQVPSILDTPQGLILGLDKQRDDVKAQLGFFPLIIPEYDPLTQQKLSTIEWVEANKHFTYRVVDLDLDIDLIREQKLEELYDAMDQIQAAGRRYFTMKRDKGESVPSSVQTRAAALYARFDELRSEIEEETDVKKLVRWKVPMDEVKAAINEQKKLK